MSGRADADKSPPEGPALIQVLHTLYLVSQAAIYYWLSLSTNGASKKNQKIQNLEIADF